jgi:hypothetical protein
VHNVAGAIAAGDYDDGLQGVGTATGTRSKALGGLKAGQWVKYSVNVPSAGYYDVTCYVAAVAGARFHLEFNGVNVIGPVDVKSASAGRWFEVHIPHVHLIAGDQYMKRFAESELAGVKSIGISNH